jgi:hypothetical protein
MAEQNNIFAPSSSITKKDIQKLGFEQSRDILGVAMAQWKLGEDDNWKDVGTRAMVIHYKDYKRKNYFIGVNMFLNQSFKIS